MLNVELQLTFDGEAHSPAPIRGWFLPSRQIGDWVAALDVARVHSPYRLFIAPNSISDTSAAGLIYLTEPPGADDQNQWAATKLGHQPVESVILPLGAIGLYGTSSSVGNTEMWLPTNSKLSPNVAVDRLLSEVSTNATRTYVWLPSIGLIAFEPSDAIEITQLLRPAKRVLEQSESLQHKELHQSKWKALPSVVTLPNRIVDILLPPVAQFEQLFQEEETEIGNDFEQLKNIDSNGNPRNSIIQKLGDSVKQALRNWLKRSADKRRSQELSQPPPSKPSKRLPPSPGMIQRMTAALYWKLARRMQSERESQIAKLLAMIKVDPDKALRFAIPLAGFSAMRGFATPSNKLTEHNTDFSLGRLYGSGRVDAWELSPQMREQLQAAYRSQANRELAAGRYRRAAYIHAHLLGDLTAAAKILENGKQYQEAAVIYGDKLNRPLDQARCFALAGQFKEAAAIYQGHRDYEAAAKLWEAAGDKEKMIACYKRAVEFRISKVQYLEAAKLVDEKLHNRPGAEALLWHQWPHGSTARECAGLAFEWMAEGGRHDQACAKLSELESHTSVAHQMVLAQLTATIAQSYPDPKVRSLAEDSCRIAAVNGIRSVSNIEQSDRLSLLRRLNPEDNILYRDTLRFEKSIRKSHTARPIIPRQSKVNSLSSLHFPAYDQILCARMIGEELCLIARDVNRLYCTRASDLVQGPCKTKSAIIQDLDRREIQSLWMIHRPDQNEVAINVFTTNERLESSTVVGPPLSGPNWKIRVEFENALCGDAGQDGSLWTIDSQAELLRNQNQHLVETFELRKPLSELVRLPDVVTTNLIVIDNHPYVTCENYLLSFRKRQMELICTMDAIPNAIARSLPHTDPRLAIAGNDGLRVIWTSRDGRVEHVRDDGQLTHVTFMHGAKIIVTTPTELRYYQRNDKATLLNQRVPLQSTKVIGLLTLSAGVVGVLYKDGVLERFRID